MPNDARVAVVIKKEFIVKNQTVIPQLGFGTYGRTGPAGVDAILCALETGYRHIDTAQTYNTEKEAGEALRRSGIPRSEVFATTKISTENFGGDRVIPSLERSLDALRIGPVDLTLIHWPSPNGRQPLEEYLVPLLLAQDRGMTRLIGVSNFTIALIDQAISIAGLGRIANNQVELNPWLQNRNLANHCQEREITVTCYLPIAKGALGRDPVIASIARRLSATPEQVALAWEFARGYVAIPTSGKPDHIRANFEALKLQLSSADDELIGALDIGRRSIDPAWGPDWD